MSPDANLPEFFYRELPDGTLVRAKVIGVDPDWGFPLTKNEWEPVPDADRAEDQR